MSKRNDVNIDRIGSAHLHADRIAFSVQHSDGSFGELTLPIVMIGQLTQFAHSATLGASANEGLELTVLRIGLARNDKDQAVLKLDTAEAHSLLCIVPRDQAESAGESLLHFDDLPLFRYSPTN